MRSYSQNAREIIPAKTPAVAAPTVLDVVQAASALARAPGEELPVSSPTIAPPTRAETIAHRAATGGDWNQGPIEVGDVVRAASANARKSEA